MAIYGWMHVATMGAWQDILQDQFGAVLESGLLKASTKIHIGAVGPRAKRLYIPTGPYAVVYQGNDEKEFEFPTLRDLWLFCRRPERKPDDYVWYIHTKGASWKGSPDWMRQGYLWRKYLEHFVLHRFRDCIAGLAGHDCVGPHYRHHKFFAGNFWWARASHIAKLGEPISHDRMYAETWLFNSEPKPRVLSMFDVPYQNPGLQPVSAAEYALTEYWGQVLHAIPNWQGWVQLLSGLWALRPHCSFVVSGEIDSARLLRYVLMQAWPAPHGTPVRIGTVPLGDEYSEEFSEPLSPLDLRVVLGDWAPESPGWRLAWRQHDLLPAAIYEVAG